MKNIALIGATGSVGKEIFNQLLKIDNLHVDTFTRKNLSYALNSEYDIVICAAPSSGKLKTNLGFDNSDKEIEKLCKIIKEIKTNRFILISSQAAIYESEKPYGKVQRKVLDSVFSYHSNHTVYLVDTIYGTSLNKGFISDIITKQWSFLADDYIQKLPELMNYYKKIKNTNLWEGYNELPKDLLEKLPNIVDIYPDDKIFQVTPISALARTVVENMEVSQGLKISISETEIFTGKQIKNLYENPNEDIFLGRYFLKKKLQERKFRMKVYYNDRGFQLGNLLFVLMQAHKDRLAGIEESYVLRTGYFKFAQSFFPKTAQLFGKAQGCELEPFGYYQISEQDYNAEVLDSFCREYLLERAEELSSQFDNKNITIAIRRTDFLAGDRASKYGYDAVKYVIDCLEIIKEKEGNISDLTIRITSDDITWCKEELAPKLKVLFSFSNEIVVEEQDIQDNFLQLYATDKYFITPNSTYGYWVGYVLRVSGRNVQTFAPNFNTTLIEDGRQIADTRDWILVDVDRSMYNR